MKKTSTKKPVKKQRRITSNKPNSEKLSASQIMVKLTKDEKALIKKTAKEHRQSMSAFLATTALDFIRNQGVRDV